MPRVCSICIHHERPAIDAGLVAGEPYRAIAQRFAASPDAVLRHKGHLPAGLVLAEQAAEVARADDLLSQVRDLRSKAYAILLAAEREGDYRTALGGIREARACLELLLEVEGELDRRPQVNVLVSGEWLAVRAAILQSLEPHQAARQAVAARLVDLEGSR